MIIQIHNQYIRTSEIMLTVQLTDKLILACTIHGCIVQFYQSDLLKLACHMRVRFLVLHSSQIRVLYVSQTLCILHARKTLRVKSGVLHRNKTWQIQSYCTLLYWVVILVYQIPLSLVHYSIALISLTIDILHHGMNTCTATCIMKSYQKLLY